jgi:hypothetical protein
MRVGIEQFNGLGEISWHAGMQATGPPTLGTSPVGQKLAGRKQAIGLSSVWKATAQKDFQPDDRINHTAHRYTAPYDFFVVHKACSGIGSIPGKVEIIYPLESR